MSVAFRLCVLALFCLPACASGNGRARDTGSGTGRDGGMRDAGATPDAHVDAFVLTMDDANVGDVDAWTPGIDGGTPGIDGGAMDAGAMPADAGHDAAVSIDAGHDAWSAPITCGTSADCTRCGTGMVCVSGTCAANPTSLTYDFESGAFPTGWTHGTSAGATAWRMVTTGAHGGTHAIESGAIGNSASSGISATIALAATSAISFWLHTDTESCCDHLQFFVDGTVQTTEWSGATAWTQVTFLLAAGTHTLEWRYTKDGSLTGGADAVWIDDVTITTMLPNNATGFEATPLPAGYTGSGSAPWVTVAAMPHGGTRDAASGVITDDETSSMTTTVAVPAATTLTFWYRVSSESGFDYLQIYIDGTMQDEWSGTVAWTMASYPLAVGTHTVEWRYSKDVSLSAGSDRAWVDDVDFHIVSTPGPICN